MEPLDDLRLLGVDYGRRRTGLALSDPEGRIAHPLLTLTFRGLDDLAARIVEKAKECEAGGIVLGFPRHLDGSPGDLGPEVHGLADRLRARGLRVVLWDERLTTWEAEQRLKEAGRSLRKDRERIDAAAAAVLLQSYLDSLRIS